MDWLDRYLGPPLVKSKEQQADLERYYKRVGEYQTMAATRAAVIALAQAIVQVEYGSSQEKAGFAFTDVKLLAKEFLALWDDQRNRYRTTGVHDAPLPKASDEEVRLIALKIAVECAIANEADSILHSAYMFRAYLQGDRDDVLISRITSSDANSPSLHKLVLGEEL